MTAIPLKPTTLPRVHRLRHLHLTPYQRSLVGAVVLIAATLLTAHLLGVTYLNAPPR